MFPIVFVPFIKNLCRFVIVFPALFCFTVYPYLIYYIQNLFISPPHICLGSMRVITLFCIPII